MENEGDEFLIEIEKEWKVRYLKPRLKELLEIFPEGRSAIERKMRENNRKIKILAEIIKEKLGRGYVEIKDKFGLWFWDEYVKVFWGNDMDSLIKENKRIFFTLNPPQIQNGDINREMIDRAKTYPLRDLIETNKNFALCIFHQEKTPSLYIKNNHFKCFGCGISGDVIDFVMKRDGLSFKEAVKFLNQ